MNALIAMFGLGGPEIVLILVVILLLFGAKKLPELARGLGSGIKEFKKATTEIESEVQRAMDQPVNNNPPQNNAQNMASQQPQQQPAQQPAANEQNKTPQACGNDAGIVDGE